MCALPITLAWIDFQQPWRNSARCLPRYQFGRHSWLRSSRCGTGVGCDNAAELLIAPDWAVPHGPEIDL